MNNLQRWLLARLPRPLVVLLLLAGNVLMALAASLALIGAYILAVMLLKPLGITAMDVLIVVIGLIAAGVLRWLYVSVGDELPKREKKK